MRCTKNHSGNQSLSEEQGHYQCQGCGHFYTKDEVADMIEPGAEYSIGTHSPEWAEYALHYAGFVQFFRNKAIAVDRGESLPFCYRDDWSVTEIDH